MINWSPFRLTKTPTASGTVRSKSATTTPPLLAAGLYDIPAEPDKLNVYVWCEVGQFLAEYFPRRTVSPATEWLDEQIVPLPAPLDSEPFCQGWMEQYRASQGGYPRDSRRIFNRSLDAACQTLGRIYRH